MKAKKRASTLKFEDKNPDRMGAETQPESRQLGQKPAPEMPNMAPQPQEDPTPSKVTMASDLEQEAVDDGPKFEDFSKYKDLAMREQYPHMTPEYREWAESTASEVDFDDLFMGEVRQSIKLNRNSGIEVEYRTLVQRDMVDLQSFAGPMNLTDSEPNLKYYAYQLCMSITRVANVVLPPYRDSKGEFDEKLFEQRLKVVDDLPYMTMQFVDVHRRWFMERVGKMFGDPKAEQLKNG